MSFLPQDYAVPSTSGGNYMKFDQGENKFRVLSDKPIIGFEYWTPDNKPVRLREQPKDCPSDIRLQDGKTWQQCVKHFWAMAVWNYQTNRVEILEVTQKSVQSSLLAIFQDADWGHPSGYDLVVTRKGEGLETEYGVKSKPHSDVDPAIMEAHAASFVNMEALFDGEDPFADSSK